MAKPLLMFTWTDVREALETIAETPRQRRAVCWLLERLKAGSELMSPDELLVEIISTGQLLHGEPLELTSEPQSHFGD
ncbi:MAG: hypothetical protein WA840_22605 [Caulobacteraceae bacterium]